MRSADTLRLNRVKHRRLSLIDRFMAAVAKHEEGAFSFFHFPWPKRVVAWAQQGLKSDPMISVSRRSRDPDEIAVFFFSCFEVVFVERILLSRR